MEKHGLWMTDACHVLSSCDFCHFLGDDKKREVILTELIFDTPGVMDVHAKGSWMSAFRYSLLHNSQDLTEALDLGRPRKSPSDVRKNARPRTSSLDWFFVFDFWASLGSGVPHFCCQLQSKLGFE